MAERKKKLTKDEQIKGLKKKVRQLTAELADEKKRHNQQILNRYRLK